jgi:hypothetical protein
VLSLSLTSLKIYRRAKKGKKEKKILVYVEEYLQEVPLRKRQDAKEKSFTRRKKKNYVHVDRKAIVYFARLQLCN